MHQFALSSLQRYLELDDQFEQERRAMRGRDKEREKRERELEKKAREQADQRKPSFPTYLCFGARGSHQSCGFANYYPLTSSPISHNSCQPETVKASTCFLEDTK